ncbi:MAG: TlpA disulfide reductase family protein [Candidatus Bipolaricaulota bacterium]|nr:TlpA disulfide reductase family protein [Candidatus Bipolaricaulota bacterium]
MINRLVFVLSLIVALSSVSLVATTGSLEYVDSILDLTTAYYPQAVQLSSDAISGLIEPTYSGTPMYASLTLAHSNYALVIDQDGSDGKLYVDANGDNELAPVDWVQQLWDGGYLASVSFKISNDSGTRPYRLFLVWNPSTPTAIIYFRDDYMSGQIELGGITYKIAIIDENSDGVFDDLDHDQLLIDIDQDSELLTSSDSHERYWLDAPFNIDGTVYAATRVSSGGSEIVIEKSDAWVNIKVPLAIGFTAPNFSVVDAVGNDLSLSSLRGKIVFLDFWASWCAPCREELPHVEQVTKDYTGRGVVVIGINLDRNEGAFTGAVSFFGLTYRQVFEGADGGVSSLYRVSGIPMSYLIDRDGIIHGKSLRGNDLKQAIEELLNQ